jgi:hypothetical protein
MNPLQYLPVLLFLVLIGSPAIAQESGLGTRVLFHASTAAGSDQWETDAGVSVEASSNGMLKLSLSGKSHGSAAPRGVRLKIEPETAISFRLGNRSDNADVTLQIEWLDARGTFLEATDALRGAAAAEKGIESRKIAEFLPAALDGKARQFRVKLWIGGGEGATASIETLQIVSPRRWQQKDVQLVRAYDATSTVEADAGMIVVKSGSLNLLKAQLEADKPYSALVLAERSPINTTSGVVMVDLSSLSSGASVSLQALCWDQDGKFLSAVDLMKDILEAGTYEVPLSIYVDQFPANARTISFKLWLGGKQPVANLAGVYYGVTGN